MSTVALRSLARRLPAARAAVASVPTARFTSSTPPPPPPSTSDPRADLPAGAVPASPLASAASRTFMSRLTGSSSIRPAYSQGARARARAENAALERATQSSVLTPTFAQKIGTVLGLNSKAQTYQRETLYVYEQCAAGADAHLDWLVSEVGLPDTFQTWFSVTQVHVWMAMVRLRAEGPKGKEWIQGLVNHMFRDMEDRLWAMGIRKNSIVDRSLKDCLSMFYGGILAYDEALTHSDALLASALWRNLFQSQADPVHLAQFVRVVREELAHLEQVPANEMLKGRFAFLSTGGAQVQAENVAAAEK
ncbi:hypothetical protein AMAG_06667 [Allomyces macrogynus ATCC 38327]|uniref:Ubiquinol-cytochrome c chaperone domain-containing protein n=1 Tax=Allomyces macrogynus (strain ATCC 38327) TaxID=578462 RepID=A0A0L0SEN1_ALLM3|nr:hypothetical protein AMAG_06667 [Allomyces macrogynus ATCC 38327]|eukprot:KNE60907.1 hypothetical protein AMAG_06667 [Allomyces macrogynus ATCC 38327]